MGLDLALLNRVETYYNLHKGCLSFRIINVPRRQRISHAKAMILNNVRFTVQQSGRLRVLKEKRKNVHAYVRGWPVWIARLEDDLEDCTPDNMERQGYRKITYNPYKYDSFVFADTEEPIYGASQVVVIGKQLWLSGKALT